MSRKLLSKWLAFPAIIFTSLFGQISWQSPSWLRYLKSQAAARPKTFYGFLSGAFFLLILLAGGYHWYSHLPQPQRIAAKITSPDITPLGETLTPKPLIIDFVVEQSANNLVPASVAPLQNIGKPVAKGITLSPEIDGQWQWQGDNRLIFTPKHDWPAGQTFAIQFKPEVFSASKKMASLAYSFSTKPFEAKIASLTFYQDPVNAQDHKAVATVEFNFPVDPVSFESQVLMRYEALKKGQKQFKAEQFPVKVTYDAHKRTAYLHTQSLALPPVARYLELVVPKGVKSASDTAATTHLTQKTLLIPEKGSYFKVTGVDARIVRNERGEPEQVLSVETSLGVTERALNKAIQVYLLPRDYPETSNQRAIKNYYWSNPGEVSWSIIAAASSLPMQAIPAERNYASLHSYRFNTQTPQYLYIKIDKGLKGFGDFELSHSYETVVQVPAYPKEVRFLHQGALMALSSEKKLSTLVRGMAAVKFTLARVLPENVNQLVTQTEGDFSNPYFINQSFNQQNISQLFEEIKHFDSSDASKQQYTALDFEKYLENPVDGFGPRGLFLLQAAEWDEQYNYAGEVRARRLVLITDLGMVVKNNKDKTHDVFVQSITDGLPVINARVAVLGKNGLPVMSVVTDWQGWARFPALDDYTNDKEPVAYLASLGNDVSFIPYNNENRQLNYSRYDVGGTVNERQGETRLSAYLFSDRGIYRPGDEAHIGMIVKQTFVAPQPAGLPLQATVTDPRGNTMIDKHFTLDDSGLLSFDIPTQVTSPTGQYFINLYTVKDNRPDSYLGSTSIQLMDFQPDRMRIQAQFSEKQSEGWISPKDLKANVSLWNLYGAPAEDRRVQAKMLLAPRPVQFKKFQDYVFADPLRSPDKPGKVFTDELTAQKTDKQGLAQFDLHLERFEKATAELTFFAEGFEAEGGRSVTTQIKALVSPLNTLIGYKTDSDLRYLKQHASHTVHFIAIDPHLALMPAKDLTLELYALHPVSTLVKKPDGTFQYQSVVQSSLVRSQPFAIDAQGSSFTLPTGQIGDFKLQVVDKANTVLNQLTYTVAGSGQVPMPKNAQLSVKLNKEEYKAGEDIELQISAPYTGTGLITIERDKVEAVQWFQTENTSTVQTIHIPESFQGNGYVNVTFVRDWDSPEIFTSPLSYSVEPFKVNHDAHKIATELGTPALARPGEDLTIYYKTDRPAKIIVFAVDEGILQVARYVTPDPLAFFFAKKALEVQTFQTVDQILPKFIRERELSAVGGDDGEALLKNRLNPFKRKADLPVVFWSGILDSGSTMNAVHYAVPEYFSGTLRVMAVAVAGDAIGSGDKDVLVRGHFVINPNVPTFVAPGDTFEVSASIANNVQQSGDKAAVSVKLAVSDALEIIGQDSMSLQIGEGHEKAVHFKLRSKALLGSANVKITAQLGDKSSKMDASLSVRPASGYETTIASGSSREVQKRLRLDRALFHEYRQVEAAMSSSPVILLTGLQRYLDNYPFGCTEQLVSKAMPMLAMINQPWFSQGLDTIHKKIDTTFQMLGQRQMSNKGFAYWPGSVNDHDRFVSIYAMQFMTEAKDFGISIPEGVFSGGIQYLKDVAAQPVTNLPDARIQAYAIYILTRNEVVTSNYLTHLQAYLEKDQASSWHQDLTAAYMAASYQLLKSQEEAVKLIRQYKPDAQSMANDFYNQSIANAQYLYLLAQHFPAQLAQYGEPLVLPLVDAMNSTEMNTVLAGYTSLALNAYGYSKSQAGSKTLSIEAVLANDTIKALPKADSAYQKDNIDESAVGVLFKNPDKQLFFYQLTQSGFDKSLPTKPLQQGIEVYREYRNTDGDVITSATLGEEIEVHIQIRALKDVFLTNIAVTDLLPGGFELVRGSPRLDNVDYFDAREDRVNYFLSLSTDARELIYRIKAVNIGEYTVPPILAQSMYSPGIVAHGAAGKISVVSPE